MILPDSEDALSEEQFWRSKRCAEAKGVSGSDGISDKRGARLDSNLSAMNRARVWTDSLTMAEHIQQEAIAREGPLHSEELFHLLKTVIPGEALSHAMQFAQRLRDTADEELVTPLENFGPPRTENPTWLKNLIAQTRLRKLKWMRKSHRPHSNDNC